MYRYTVQVCVCVVISLLVTEAFILYTYTDTQDGGLNALDIFNNIAFSYGGKSEIIEKIPQKIPYTELIEVYTAHSSTTTVDPT